MKKKRILTALLATAMALGTAPTAFAADITVTVDGQKVDFGDQEPINLNGRVMVPVRAVAEKMGWEVSFEKFSTNDSPVVDGKFQEYNHVLLYKTVKEDKDLNRKYLYSSTITIEKKTILSGNSGYFEEEKALVADPVIQNGRTLLGIRDLADGLNAEIRWDGATKTVAITTKPVEQFPNYDKLLQYIEEYREVVNGQADSQKEQEESGTKNNEQKEETSQTDESEFAEQVIRLINEERVKAGLNPLEKNDKLMDAATVRVEEISEVFGHTRPDGSSCKTAVADAGFEGTRTGENIAGGQDTPEKVVKAWMDSEGHKNNILNPNFKYTGVGYLHKSQGFYTEYDWVQIFAR